MDTIDKEIVDDRLTQADLIRLMLHNAQHMATREEVKADIKDLGSSLNLRIDKLDTKIDKVEATLKQDISNLDTKIDKVEATLKQDISNLDTKIDKVEATLKQDILNLEANTNSRFDKIDEKFDKIDAKFDKMEEKITKVDTKFDKIQWLILATLFTVVFKDYIVSLIANQ
jgi:predicted  nucleic acid-binding Zn-ribbon protein